MSSPTERETARTLDQHVTGSFANTVETRAADSHETPIPSVPGYEILATLGRGGMGVVYKARHLALKRTVALKMMLGSAHADDKDRARFRAEAEAVARLQHPHIVQVHEIGEHDGHPYAALEFVDGGTLARKLKSGPMPFRESARIVETLADAVQWAHSRNIVHRDLKPANVLLTAEGSPKVADFGLARQLDSDSSVTQAGTVMGTPSYMAPEQALGLAHTAGPTADVYALGAILYECLTGRPPFAGENVLATLEAVRSQEPAVPHVVRPGVPNDLETICLKCLRKEPEKRYASAQALAEDLRRWQLGEPITARPVGTIERTAKWVRRRPAIAGLMAGIVAVMVTGAALVTWKWLAASAALEEASRQRRERALAQVNALRDAAPGAVPGILAELERQRDDVLPRLRELWAEQGNEARRMRVGMALLPVQPDDVRPALMNWITQTTDPAEALLVRDALRPIRNEVLAELRDKALGASSPANERFLAMLVLAGLEPDNPDWPTIAPLATDQLLAANPLHLGLCQSALTPVGKHLVPALAQRFRTGSESDRRLSALLLGSFAAGMPDILADVLLDANAVQFTALWPAVERGGNAVATAIRQERDRPDPPLVDVAARDRQARRRALAAIALFRLTQDPGIWMLLRQSPDPAAASYLIHCLAEYGIPAMAIVERLMQEPDASIRQALILGLGHYSASDFGPGAVAALTQTLLTWYRDDPDPGVHAAIDWLMRHAKQGPKPRRMNWGQAESLSKIDLELIGPPLAGRHWYGAPEGHTLAVVRKPEPFAMGSPEFDPDQRKTTEQLHIRLIPRTYAIGLKEVTVEQYERFVKSVPGRQHSYAKHYSPDPSGGAVGMTWYDAAGYCNWLSKLSGLPESEWCYPKELGERMKLADEFLARKGFRLPTEAEWEYACRAGTSTSRFFGNGTALIDEYAWYYANSDDRAWPVGQLKPNRLGLFDTYGNVLEWCQDRFRAYPFNETAGQQHLDMPGPLDFMVPDSSLFGRSLRGGSFGSRPPTLRSAMRLRDRAGTRFDSVGFRVAQTVEDHTEPGWFQRIKGTHPFSK